MNKEFSTQSASNLQSVEKDVINDIQLSSIQTDIDDKKESTKNTP